MFLFDTKIIADAITKASTPLWLTVILALVPVGISIVVFIRQNRIMKQQNDIALFDKRYEVYCNIQDLIVSLKNNLEDLDEQQYQANISKDIFLGRIFSRNHKTLQFYATALPHVAIAEALDDANFFLLTISKIKYLFIIDEKSFEEIEALHNVCWKLGKIVQSKGTTVPPELAKELLEEYVLQYPKSHLLLIMRNSLNLVNNKKMLSGTEKRANNEI